MAKIYSIPIYGKLISNDPPAGDSDKPVQPVSLREIPDAPELVLKGEFTEFILGYNFDNEECEISVDAEELVYTWLDDALAEPPGGKSKIRQYMDDNNLVLVRADLET